jgi:CHAT domain-containing protein
MRLPFWLLLISSAFLLIRCDKKAIVSVENLPITQRKAETDTLLQWIEYYQNLDINSNDPTHQSQISYCDTILNQKWRNPKNNAEFKALIITYLTKAWHQKQRSKYQTAKETYQLAFQKSQLAGYDTCLTQSEYGSWLYRELGNIYTRLGDYERAEVLLQLFLRSAENPQSIAECYNDLGIIQNSKGEYVKAISFFKKGVLEKKLSDNVRGLLLQGLGFSYSNLEKYILAEKYLKESYTNLSEVNKYTTIWKINTLSLLGNIYAKTGEKKQMEKVFSEAFLLANETYENEKGRREVSKLKSAYGNALMNFEEAEKALKYYHEALHIVLPNLDTSELFSFPKATNFYPENAIAEALQGKAKAFEALAEKTDEKQYLEAALTSYELIFEAEYQLRKTYQYEGSKLLSIANVRAFSESAITILYDLITQTNDEKLKKEYARKAFQMAERSKAMVLTERLRKLKAKNQLPQNIQDQDWNFQRLITEQYQNLQFAIQESKDSLQSATYASLALLNDDYQSFLDSISIAFPNYQITTSNEKSIDLVVVQQELLNKNQTIVEYFLGIKNQFVFTIAANDFIFDKIEVTKNTDSLTNTLITSIKSTNNTSNINDFIPAASQTYQTYFEKITQDLTSNEVIIIPDANLNYLPFEVLINAKKITKKRFDKLPYLVKDFQFTYGYSAQSLLTLQNFEKKKTTQTFLGIAPNFENSNLALNPLKFNTLEVENINQRLGGKQLQNTEATKQNFLQAAGTANVLHLATHAVVNDSAANQSAIFFANDSSLTISEVYNLPLSARLVTLSACQTGDGQLATGEGVMSLARAFMYQGCPSIVASLWSVNDKSTATIMDVFYQNLSNGQTKSAALQNAKISYLENTGLKGSQPFYWSAFVIVGENEAISNDGFSIFWWLFGSFLVLIIGYWGIRFYKK